MIFVIVLDSGVKRKRKKLDERGKTSKEAKQRKEQPKMSSKNIIPNLEELKNHLMSGNEEFLRHALTKMLNLMMELEVEAKTKAGKYERNKERDRKSVV